MSSLMFVRAPLGLLLLAPTALLLSSEAEAQVAFNP